ncbi:nuclear GTPase SLIP-GC-like isoform X2, partial [Arapaima gigas]
MYTSMKNSNIFLQTFRPGNSRQSRQSINGRLESFKEAFNLTQDLKANKKQPEKYLRQVCIKTKQRKLLSNMEKEILQRKKSIYNSLSRSVQATMMPAYTDFSGAEKYTMTNIQNRLREKVQSSKNTIFQQAMKEMLRQFEDLK